MLGKNVRPGLDIPDWFNEGFAQFVSRGDQHDREIFYLVATGKLLPLPELDHIDALHGPNREFPTIQGLAVVQFLVHEYGQDKLWDLVGSLSHSRTFSQALLDTYGRSDLELSDQWLAYAGERVRDTLHGRPGNSRHRRVGPAGPSRGRCLDKQQAPPSIEPHLRQ